MESQIDDIINLVNETKRLISIFALLIRMFGLVNTITLLSRLDNDLVFKFELLRE